MPSLPIYNSRESLQANTAEPLRNEASQPFEQDQKVLATLGDITQKWSDANDVMQYTQFKADTSIAIAKAKSAAKEDPNQNNVDLHMKSLGAIKKNGTAGITNQVVAQKASAELDNDLALAGIEIDAEFKRKQMITTQLKLEETVRTLSAQKSESPTSARASQIDLEMMGLVQANVATGVITEAHGRKMLDDYRLGAVDLDIMNDSAMEKDNSFVYAQLKAGKDGIYHDLSDAERADRMQSTELHIRRNKIMGEYAQTQNQDANEKELLAKHGTDSVTEGQVKDLLLSTGVRKDFGKKYMESMYEAPPESTDYEAYNKVKLAQLNGKKAKEINTLLIDSISDITPSDREALLKSSYDALDSKTITIKASAEALTRWAHESLQSNSPVKDANEVVFNFFQRLDKDPNQNIDVVMQGVQKDYIKKHYPSTTSLQDVPNLVGNRNKIVNVYKKESKMGGNKVSKKPVSSVYQNMNIGFDDL